MNRLTSILKLFFCLVCLSNYINVYAAAKDDLIVPVLQASQVINHKGTTAQVLEAYVKITAVKFDGDELIKDMISFSFASGFKHLPKSDFLRYIWGYDNLKSKKVSIEKMMRNYEEEFSFHSECLSANRGEVETIVEPDEKSFKACNDYLLKNDVVINIKEELQHDMLIDGEVTQTELKNAYNIIAVNSNRKLDSYKSISFRDVPINVLLNIIFEQSGLEIKTSASLASIHMNVEAKNSTGQLIFSNLIESIDLEVLCNESMIYFKSKKPIKEPKTITLLSYFKTKKNIITSNSYADTVEINWEDKVTYKGGYKNNQFEGKGELIFLEKGSPYMKIKGSFTNGMLNGYAKEVFLDNSYSYKGGFKNGFHHGQGHLINKNDPYCLVDQKGMFTYGEFTAKNGVYYFKRGEEYNSRPTVADYDKMIKDREQLTQYIRYEGPLTNAIPNGEGHCYLKEIDYPCTFYKGYLIGINDSYLLPDYIKNPVL